MLNVNRFFHHRMSRFAVVGISNAVISFGMLNLCFSVFGLGKVTASIISTSCAVLFSFALNRSFVFADNTKLPHRQILPFVVVTVSGSVGVLNVIYILSNTYLEHHGLWLVNFIYATLGSHLGRNFIEINLSTVVGAIVAMVWNYNGYRLFVFNGKRYPNREDELKPAQA